MHGLKTIYQMNRANEEAARIMAKHADEKTVEQTPPMTAAQRTEVAQATMKRILNGARG